MWRPVFGLHMFSKRGAHVTPADFHRSKALCRKRGQNAPVSHTQAPELCNPSPAVLLAGQPHIISSMTACGGASIASFGEQVMRRPRRKSQGQRGQAYLCSVPVVLNAPLVFVRRKYSPNVISGSVPCSWPDGYWSGCRRWNCGRGGSSSARGHILVVANAVQHSQSCLQRHGQPSLNLARNGLSGTSFRAPHVGRAGRRPAGGNLGGGWGGKECDCMALCCHQSLPLLFFASRVARAQGIDSVVLVSPVPGIQSARCSGVLVHVVGVVLAVQAVCPPPRRNDGAMLLCDDGIQVVLACVCVGGGGRDRAECCRCIHLIRGVYDCLLIWGRWVLKTWSQLLRER